jgi:transposase
MASLVAKNVRGRRYWQIVTCRRVHGKPRQVVLAHLGTADRLLEKLQQGKPVQGRVLQFGLLAAAWRLARDLGLIELIDQHVPKRRQGPSVGQYLILATLNRLVQPASKARLARWYHQTALRRWLPLPRAALRSQRFWDHMDAVDEQAIARIEADLSRRLVHRHAIDLRCLCFDCTNFDTFIDSQNPAALPQRGHAKSKRTDLRVVGLGLLVSTDFNIPLFSHVYPGNQPDAVTFASISAALVERYHLLARELDHVTLVFDKGNNSADNLAALAEGPYHVVGSLVPTQHPELLALPLRHFTKVPDHRLPGVTAYRTSKELYGTTWTLVVTRSDSLLRGQLRGIAQHLSKRRRALAELQHKLARSQRAGAKGKGYTLESLQRHAKELSQGQYLKEILRIDVRQRRGRLSLTYRTDAAALARLQRTVLGKRILFTDNHDWSTAAIILAYRSQHHVEATFRQIKEPACLSWRPVHHWTDSKIRVHSFCCVLALTLLNLLHRQAWQAGIPISNRRLRDELAGIQEVIHLYPSSSANGAGRYRAQTTYSLATPTASRLADLFGLTEFQVD